MQPTLDAAKMTISREAKHIVWAIKTTFGPHSVSNHFSGTAIGSPSLMPGFVLVLCCCTGLLTFCWCPVAYFGKFWSEGSNPPFSSTGHSTHSQLHSQLIRWATPICNFIQGRSRTGERLIVKKMSSTCCIWFFSLKKKKEKEKQKCYSCVVYNANFTVRTWTSCMFILENF